ncbi:MAG: hypothetical protein K1Y36_17225 [Blastocatellia bacterium]|nr:hypothetical protein [Blastocatellia bacterium]
MRRAHGLARFNRRTWRRKQVQKLTENRALVQLREIKQGFARYIDRNFGRFAEDCSKCTTPCCADAQFVNINITRLEARAMIETLRESSKYGPDKVAEVLDRAQATATTYGLSEEGDTFEKTYACPLFEKGVGCLVHWKAKPAPCIQHGCYENWQHLPEAGTLRRVERTVARLNEQVYEKPVEFLTIPVWLLKINRENERQ